MNTTIYQVEVDKENILLFEDFLKKMSLRILNREEKEPAKMTKEEAIKRELLNSREEARKGLTIDHEEVMAEAYKSLEEE